MADIENLDIHENGENDAPQKMSKSQKKRAAKKRKKNADAPTKEQTDPPSFPLRQLAKYQDPEAPNKCKFPEGQTTPWEEWSEEWKMKTAKGTEKERMARDECESEKWTSFRQAAEVHRTTRQWIHTWLEPGMKMFDIVEKIDAHNRILIGEKRSESNVIEAGLAFPVGVSLNDCAAHYTPNAGDNTVLKYDDVMKIDFGVHINGRIVDSAFTKTFDPKYDMLKTASSEATNAGIKAAGIDMKLSELGDIIQETMESHEIELNGKTIPIKSITNLSGHNIDAYRIHAGKQVPNCKTDYNARMDEGEVFAIETFASTGKGYVNRDPDCSHFMIRAELIDRVPQVSAKAREFAKALKDEFYTLPFCRRWIDRMTNIDGRYLRELLELVKAGWIRDYPGLSDVPGSFTSQLEHTVMLRPTCKEVVTRGLDY